MVTKSAEYVGNLLSDGHLSLPEDIRRDLALAPDVPVRITITVCSEDLGVGRAWEIFKSMRRGAVDGKLSDASERHDAYLYRGEK